MRVSRAHFVRAPLQGGAVGDSSATGTDSQSQSPPQQARDGLRLVSASSPGHAMRFVHISCVRLCRKAPSAPHCPTALSPLSHRSRGRRRDRHALERVGVGIIIRSSQAMRVSRAHFVRAPLQESAIGASLPHGTVAALTSLSGPPPRQARAGTRWCRHHQVRPCDACLSCTFRACAFAGKRHRRLIAPRHCRHSPIAVGAAAATGTRWNAFGVGIRSIPCVRVQFSPSQKRMIYHFGRPSQDFRVLRCVQFQRLVVQIRYSHPLKRASKRHSGMFVRHSKMANSSFGMGKNRA